MEQSRTAVTWQSEKNRDVKDLLKDLQKLYDLCFGGLNPEKKDHKDVIYFEAQNLKTKTKTTPQAGLSFFNPQSLRGLPSLHAAPATPATPATPQLNASIQTMQTPIGTRTSSPYIVADI